MTLVTSGYQLVISPVSMHLLCTRVAGTLSVVHRCYMWMVAPPVGESVDVVHSSRVESFNVGSTVEPRVRVTPESQGYSGL